MALSDASERLLFLAWENRLAKLDELLDATHSMMDAEQRARGELEERLTLLEEWVRLRFEELARDRPR